MKSYLKVFDGSKAKNFLVEVEVMAHERAFGRDISVIRPVSGEGHIKVNSDKVIVKKN